ncbi:hemin-degrading factor [Leisingera sp. HS039]|uniref:hemin-degrading factor n=1 Tax=unclassified Leisingera TaxID=2614906 RepID=UPI00107123E1|nr:MULTISPECIES: ChuX/HutX family heme-like substrate-binding protein [unclassified Leisingera]MBQ4824507.1 hemin-degrading factor [Leisingera sp. HS039]QBR38855.1 hemin-degrading factor [Leisingera sp. NJS201]
MTDTPMTPAAIRTARAEHSALRDRDFADKFSISEGQLVAAYAGQGVTRISADPDGIMPRLAALGEVMALTRNRSCVIEKVGVYGNYRSGQHASMILNDAIDLRLFPKHFVTAFAVERETDKGIKRSIQIFDAAGDAVHKVHLRDASDLDAWARLVADLKLEDQSQALAVEPRKPAEAPKGNPDKADALRAEWAGMTDTHQFMRLTSKLKMNRLGAYRIAGAPLARALETAAVNTMLQTVRDQGVEVMIFVGNMGCIEIHSGPVKSLREMGPWQNILDPGFDLHLRLDHIAEVWAVTKPTQRGDAVSVEAFDADGALILQVFGRRAETRDHRPAWNAVVDGLASLTAAEMA